MAVEGCSEFMGSRMEQVWPLIEAGLQDADANVRKASCVAVGCLCESLDEQCASKHAVLVPVRTVCLSFDSSPKSLSAGHHELDQ